MFLGIDVEPYDPQRSRALIEFKRSSSEVRSIEDKYFLSEFGEAALALTTSVEAPVKRKSRGLRAFGFKIDPRYVSAAIIALLIISNLYLVYTYQGLSKDRTNALGEVLIQTRGFLDESIHILNLTVRESRIDFGLWDVLLRDLVQLSRQYKLIISLDTDHRQQWSQIKGAADSLVDFVNALTQMYAKNSGYMDITHEHSAHLNTIRDHLLKTELKAFAAKIIIGSNPEVNIADSDIAEAMDTSIDRSAVSL